MSTKQKTIPSKTFDQLAPELARELRSSMRSYSFSAGEAIFIQGETADAVFLVVSGRIKIVRVTPEGFESILCVRGPGDYFCPVPILDEGCHLGTAVAMSDITLYACERTKFNNLCRNNHELLAVVQGDCISEVRHLLYRLESFAFRSIKERLAIALLDQHRYQIKHNARPSELHLTQKELAGLIGASRERVSKILNQMEREKIVALSRGCVTLCDIEQLRQLTRN